MVVPEQDIIDDLQRVADELGRTPKFEEYKDLGKFYPSTAERKFGSWNDAIKAADLEPVRYTNISHEDVVEDVERVADELDRKPEIRELRERGKYSQYVYIEHDWQEVFRPSSEEIVESIQKLGEELGKRPTREEYRQEGEYTVSDIEHRFEYWNTAVQEAGYDGRDGRPRSDP